MNIQDMTRRDALRLAKFGAFLAAGMCITRETPAAKVPADGETALLVKLYQPNGDDYELLQQVAFNKNLFGGNLHEGTSISLKIQTLKLSNTHAVGTASLKMNVAYTVKLRGSSQMLLPAVTNTLKLDSATPGVTVSRG